METQFYKLDEFPAHLEKLTPEDWKPLMDLIPEIEQATVFGEIRGMEEIRPGVLTFPYCESSALVNRFVELAYDSCLVIDFDWPHWEEGRNLASGDLSEIDSLDLITLCKLMTAIIRNDRFCEGALVESFESGLTQKILRAISDRIKHIQYLGKD